MCCCNIVKGKSIYMNEVPKMCVVRIALGGLLFA